MNKEEIEKQLKLSKRQNKDERYDYLCSEFNAINYCVDLEKYTNKLQQENKQLQEELECTIGIVEHNRIISKKNKEIHQLKDNWNKLKNCMIDIFNRTQEIYYLDLLETMQELEKGDSNE